MKTGLKKVIPTNIKVFTTEDEIANMIKYRSKLIGVMGLKTYNRLLKKLKDSLK